jgi:hypothetical protein
MHNTSIDTPLRQPDVTLHAMFELNTPEALSSRLLNGNDMAGESAGRFSPCKSEMVQLQ